MKICQKIYLLVKDEPLRALSIFTRALWKEGGRTEAYNLASQSVFRGPVVSPGSFPEIESWGLVRKKIFLLSFHFALYILLSLIDECSPLRPF